MAIEVDGEKYACEACVRGHRVSNCTHKDRELRHINKKGRPVSQCPHCRGLRKSRSAHVKCVCVVDTSQGPPTLSHNATPTMITSGAGALRLPSAAAGVGDGRVNSPGQPTTPGHACGCMHGQPCTCAVKREHGDVNEMARAAAMNATHRRSASNGKPVMSYRRSDSTVPNIRHSFHPPLHHRNHAAHEHNFPYPLKRASASHGSLGMSSVQRSVDSLPLQTYSSANTTPAHLGNWPPIPQLPSSQDLRSPQSAYASPTMATPPQFDLVAGPSTQPGSTFASRAMSPGSQQRHSMNDFSALWSSDLSSSGAFGQSVPAYFVSSVPSSATDSLPMSWSELDLAGSFQYNAMAQQNPPAPSVESVDPQPSLSRSSSGTESDTAESSHTNFGDFSFGSLSQPSTNSLNSQWQAGSWPGHSARVDMEDAFSQQKTPRAPHPNNYIGNMDDYFGSYGSDVVPSAAGPEASSASVALEQDMPTWSSASPPVTAGYGDMAGLMMPSHASGCGDGASEAWSSQIDLSSYGAADNLDMRQEHGSGPSGSGGNANGDSSDQFMWR